VHDEQNEEHDDEDAADAEAATPVRIARATVEIAAATKPANG
jgi:hypothetical protein